MGAGKTLYGFASVAENMTVGMESLSLSSVEIAEQMAGVKRSIQERVILCRPTAVQNKSKSEIVPFLHSRSGTSDDLVGKDLPVSGRSADFLHTVDAAHCRRSCPSSG